MTGKIKGVGKPLCYDEPMNALILLGAIAGVPVLLALVFRVSAIYLFLSIAAGSLLVTYIGDDASLALGMVVRGQNTTLITQFALLLVPVGMSLLFLRKSLPKSVMLFHVPVLVAAGAALAALALPYMDSNVQQQLFSTRYGNVFRNAQDVVVAAAAGMTLILMWLTAGHKEGKHKKH